MHARSVVVLGLATLILTHCQRAPIRPETVDLEGAIPRETDEVSAKTLSESSEVPADLRMLGSIHFQGMGSAHD